MKTTTRAIAAALACWLAGGCQAMFQTTAFPPHVDDPARLSPGARPLHEPLAPSSRGTARPSLGTPETAPPEGEILDLDRPSRDDAEEIEPSPKDGDIATAIELTVEAERRKQAGSDVRFQIVVENTADRAAENVVIEADFDQALVFPGRREKRIRQVLGRMAAGESRNLGLLLVGDEAGTHCARFTVTVDEREAAWKEVCVEFVERHLEVSLIGPSTRTVGSHAEFTIKVANAGSTTVESVTATVGYGDSLQPREGSTGAEFEPGELTWNVGDLKAGDGVELQIEFECTAPADESEVTVLISGKNVPEERHRRFLRIAPQRGMLAVDLRDLRDPVARGEETSYEITVRNRGPQEARDVVLSLLMPEQLRLASSGVARGDEELGVVATADGQKVNFPAIESLAVGQVLTYRVTAKALRAGDVELTARVSHSLSREPAVVTEPTTINP